MKKHTRKVLFTGLFEFSIRTVALALSFTIWCELIGSTEYDINSSLVSKQNSMDIYVVSNTFKYKERQKERFLSNLLSGLL